MAPLGKIDMSVFEKKNGNKRTRPRMARPSIDSKQEIIEYNQEKERIEQFFADKDDPHISLIVDITLLNSHPDVIEEIRQAFRRRYLHSPYVIIYMLSSDRNQCGETTILNETGLDAFNEALRHRIIIFETADCKNLEPGIDSTIRINQLVSLAKYHQEGSFETCIVTEDKSLVSLAYNLEVACMSYGSLYEELVKYQKYCRKGNSRVVEGNLDWGLLLPEHMYEYPISYHEYQVGKPSLNSFIDRFADYPDEEDEEGGQEQQERQDIPQRETTDSPSEDVKKQVAQTKEDSTDASLDGKEDTSQKQFIVPKNYMDLPSYSDMDDYYSAMNPKLSSLGADGMTRVFEMLDTYGFLKGEKDQQLLFYRLTGRCRPIEQGELEPINWISHNGHCKELMYFLKRILPDGDKQKYAKARLFFNKFKKWPDTINITTSQYAEGAKASFRKDLHKINPKVFRNSSEGKDEKKPEKK